MSPRFIHVILFIRIFVSKLPRKKAESKWRHIPVGVRSTVDAERELMSEIRGNPFSLAIVEEDPSRSQPGQFRSRYCRHCRSAKRTLLPPFPGTKGPSVSFSPVDTLKGITKRAFRVTRALRPRKTRHRR